MAGTINKDKGILIANIFIIKGGFSPFLMAMMPIVFIEPKAKPKTLTFAGIFVC
jgi:hypothetical protein